MTENYVEFLIRNGILNAQGDKIVNIKNYKREY